MDLVAAVVADEQPLEVMQPGEGALDDPADSAEPGSVLGLTAGDHRCDATHADEPAVLVVVVTAVGHDLFGPLARSPEGAPYGWHRVE